jgi:iduronate 2-sulfatase
MTLPTYFRQHGYTTAGVGKIFHPDACYVYPAFRHTNGDDPRAWSYYDYGVEANNTQEQWGGIPGPHDPIYNGTMGLSFFESPLSDEQQTDGMLATNAVLRFRNFSRDGIGKKGGNRPFFHAVGFHKPHLPHVAPKKYFDLYDITKVSLPPNPKVPSGFMEHNWYNNGNAEMRSYTNMGAVFAADDFGFHHPLDDDSVRHMRRGYFAAVSFVDACVGRVLDALEQYGFKDNTVVTMWGDHGWHLGDQNSWCKQTNFETAARNTLLWRVPGQPLASQGRNGRLVEMLDLFPTLVELAGLPAVPKCTGTAAGDQPPSVLCLQGESYADEFLQPQDGLLLLGAIQDGVGSSPGAAAKQYAFTQFAYPPVKVRGVKMPTNFRQVIISHV